MPENTEVAELRAQLAECQRIISAQAETITEGRRLLGACESHNEMVLGRLKLADAQSVELDRQVRGEPVAWAATSEDGKVEALGMNQSRRFDTPLCFCTAQPAEPVAWQKAFNDAASVAHLYHTGSGILSYMQQKYDNYANQAPQRAEPVKAEATYSDNMRAMAARNLRSFLNNSSFKLDTDRQAALTCVEVLEAKAEPVKELSVPDEIWDLRYHSEYIRGWNSCRHAMLAAAPAPQADEPAQQEQVNAKHN